MPRDEYYEAALAWAREQGYEGDALPKGETEHGTRCPLARATGFTVCSVFASDPGRPPGKRRVDIPQEVGAFVIRFDDGEYPELIEGPA